MKLYAIHFNRPDFVEIQHHLSKKFEYELVIINNGHNKEIERLCLDLNIEHIITHDRGGDPSMSHGSAINQMIHIINSDESWGLIDHDMFVVQYNTDFDIITLPCDNIGIDHRYMWPGMILCRAGINFSDVDFNPGAGCGGDTGSGTYKKVAEYNVGWCGSRVIGEHNKSLMQDSDLIQEIVIDNNIIGYHYLNGSNWTGGDSTECKNSILSKALNRYDLGIK